VNDVRKDPLALGLGSLAAGVGLGAACLTAAQIVTKVMREYMDPSSVNDPAGKALAAGLFVAIGVGGGYAWYRSWALENIWQRGVIAVLAAVGSLLMGFLAAPVDRFFDLVGLIVWFILMVAFGLAGARWASKGRGAESEGTPP
jgi:hypothetical protein